jgi:phospholipid/cholesterol/gamma-HCH transport system substrate-binding protein
MDSKINYTAVGLFVILLGLVLSATAYWLATGGKNEQFTPYVVYVTDNASGLTENSHVLYRGVDVGQVKNIRIDEKNPDKIRVMIELDENVPIRTDTVAKLQLLGVTGLSVLNLTGGKSSLALTNRNAEGVLVIPYEASIFSKLEGGASEVMVNVSRVSNQLDALMSAENIAALSSTIQNINEITTTVAQHKDDLVAMMIAGRQTLEGTAKLSQSSVTLINQAAVFLDKFSQSIKGLQGVVAATQAAVTQVSAASTSTIDLTQAGSKTLGTFNDRTLPQLGGLIEQLQQASTALTQLVKQINQNPSQILYGSAPVPPGPGETGAR